MRLHIAGGNIVLAGSSIDSSGPIGSGDQDGTLVQRNEVHKDAQVPNSRWSRIGHCPPPSRAFTGRGDILEKMHGYFFDASPMKRHIFVLCGLGGAGKTQLALTFVEMHKERSVDQANSVRFLKPTCTARFWDIFYIDATTRETISAGLVALVKAANAGTNPQDALAWLVSQEERWLLILNNADDPKLSLHEFFPACVHGDILITTRNQQMRAHTCEPRSYCGVGAMLPQDALALMLRASGVAMDEHETETASALVEVRLGVHFLSNITPNVHHRSSAFLRLQLCSQAHIYASPSVDYPGIAIYFWQHVNGCSVSGGLNR